MCSPSKKNKLTPLNPLDRLLPEHTTTAREVDVNLKKFLPIPTGLMVLLPAAMPVAAQDYPVVDTGQTECYDDTGNAMDPQPSPGETFFGQDAQHDGHRPSYSISDDGLTVRDNVTGLTWMRTPDIDNDGDIDADDKLSWMQFQDFPAALNTQSYGGCTDWRRPTIKELYSLIDFRGTDPSGCESELDCPDIVSFIDADYFEFGYGDTTAGERLIDAQYWSSTEYVSTVFGGDAAVFGVNFADGRIKGYPRDNGPGGTMTQYVRCVRGNSGYGINEFSDNGDSTVTDLATGLVWQRLDDGNGRDWEEALAYCENLALASCDDWRLPDAKELQSIVDYSRSPGTTGSAAIDPVFGVAAITDEGGGANYPFYWSSTTHANWTATPGGWGAYVAFGEALGWMQLPFPPFTRVLQDVHGAGAQRSDPKSGNPANWPYGNGPQGDVVRIYNHVRCVRGEAVPACDVRLEDTEVTLIDFYPTCPAQSLGVVTGSLSELRANGDYRGAGCLGSFTGQAFDDRGDPPTGDGYYYLVKGAGACASRGYGDANGITPDPRDDLESPDPCS
jgi:hypothetical protein